MKKKRFLAGFLAICMVFTAPCLSLADEQETMVFSAGDTAVAVNTYLYADNTEQDNPMSKIRESEIFFRTGEQLTGASEEEDETFVPLQQALEDSDDVFVDVIADASAESGLSRTERYFQPLDLEGLLGSGESASEEKTPASYKPGDTKTIHSLQTGGSFRNVTVKCIALGDTCTIWCETDDRYPELTMSEVHAKQLAKEFDDNWDNFVSYFDNYRKYPGYPSGTMDVDGDGKLAIVCYDINGARENATPAGEDKIQLHLTQYTGGFFWTGDLLPSTLVSGSNEMDCLHIDTMCGMSLTEKGLVIIPDEEHIFGDIQHSYSTLFHELQHLTEASMTGFNSLPSYLDEAFAMAAEHLVCGSEKVSHRVDHFNDAYKYGCPLTIWCYYNEPMNCLDNYASSYLFGQYLRTRYSLEKKSSITTGKNKGGDVYSKLLNTYVALLTETADAGEKIDKSALSAKALEELFGVDLDDLISDFWFAVCVQDSNGKFSFSSDGIAPEEWSKTITPRFETELPSGKAKIYNGGVKFYNITENNTELDTASNEDAAVYKVLNDKNSFTVEFMTASPSDATPAAEREYETYSRLYVEKGKTIQESDIPAPNPEKAGISAADYDFSGWFEDAALEYPFNFDDPVNKNKEAYGSWIRKTAKKDITVTFLANAPEDAEAKGSMTPQEATSYEIFNLQKNAFSLDCPLMEYTFLGWGTTPNLNDPDCRLYLDQESVVFKEDTQLYAIWKQDYDHIVIFDANGGKPNICCLLDEGECIKESEITKPTRDGYTFIGWWYMEVEDYTEKFAFDTPVTEDHYVYARWLYDSSDDSSGGSSVQTVKPDAAVTPVTVAANGNQLLGNATISTKIENLTAEEKAVLVTKGKWAKDAYGYWTLTDENGKAFKSCWVLVSDVLGSSPVGNATWYYFSADGKMATGWQWISAADGKSYCYYFNKEDGSMYGGCILSGTSVDDYSVNAKGRWTDAAGTEQTR